MTRNLIKEVKRYECLNWPLPRIRLPDSLSSPSDRRFEALNLARRIYNPSATLCKKKTHNGYNVL